MKWRKHILLLLILILLLPVACTGEKKKTPQNSGAVKTIPQGIKDMEGSLQEIMRQVDLIPVIDKLASGEGKTADLTFEATTFGEVLTREVETGGKEKKQKPPQDEAEIWNQIKQKVTALHGQWDKLEPDLMQKKVPAAVISKFEDELDSLTLFSTAQDGQGILRSANQLTGYLYQLMASFVEAPVPLTYEFKYRLRKILINAASGAYEPAREDLAFMKEQKAALTMALEDRKAGTLEAEFSASLDNLQRALDKQNFDLVKVNAAVVMENLAMILQAIE